MGEREQRSRPHWSSGPPLASKRQDDSTFGHGHKGNYVASETVRPKSRKINYCVFCQGCTATTVNACDRGEHSSLALGREPAPCRARQRKPRHASPFQQTLLGRNRQLHLLSLPWQCMRSRQFPGRCVKKRFSRRICFGCHMSHVRQLWAVTGSCGGSSIWRRAFKSATIGGVADGMRGAKAASGLLQGCSGVWCRLFRRVSASGRPTLPMLLACSFFPARQRESESASQHVPPIPTR